MKPMTIAVLLLGLLFWAPVTIEAGQSGKNGEQRDIERFYVDSEGALHVVFVNGSDILIPRERGRYDNNGDLLTQEEFKNIVIAQDHQRIGWLASYMVCAQSYPCTPELVIFDSAGGTRYFPAPCGIVWDWKFINSGKRIVIHYGFPHGDEMDAYLLYDAESGNKQSEWSATEIPDRVREIPDWVREFQHIQPENAPD
jgi:hypothetical protein